MLETQDDRLEPLHYDFYVYIRSSNYITPQAAGNTTHRDLMQQQPEYAKSYVMQALQAHKQIITFGWLCIVAYVNYLWNVGAIDSCISMAAITIQHIANNDLYNKYVLQPLYYRIQKKIGANVWTHAIANAPKTTIEQLFEEIMKELGLSDS